MIDIVDTLQMQILKVESLLRNVQAIPAGHHSGGMYGFVRYDAQSVRSVVNEVNTWLAETLEILRTVYGEDSRQQAEFQRKYRDQEQYTDFKEDVQIDLVYRETEISDAPYPGLKAYLKDRLTREKHLGSKANIDASGYERYFH